MSLAVTAKTPQGIVLATDSRLTVVKRGERNELPDVLFIDHGVKVVTLGPPNPSVAVSFFGNAASGIRSFASLVREYAQAQGQRKRVEQIAHELGETLGPKGLSQTVLHVAGFDETNPFGRVFEVAIPGDVTELHPHGSVGISLGGRKELAHIIVDALKPPLSVLPLLATASLARWLIEQTITAQGYSFSGATVGGPVQLAVLELGKSARLMGGMYETK